jgi:hypothetical protein
MENTSDASSEEDVKYTKVSFIPFATHTKLKCALCFLKNDLNPTNGVMLYI